MTAATAGERPPDDGVAEALRRATALVSAAQPEAGPLLLVTDFDGTLSPIVSEPGGARIVGPGRSALRALSRYAQRRPDRLELAVLSGRTAADVAARVRVGGLRYLGSHGAEAGYLPPRTPAERLDVRLARGLEPYVARAEDLAAGVRRRLGDPDWLFIEPKGPLVSLHYRRAQDPAAARDALVAALDAEEAARGERGFVRLESRRVVELRPGLAAGKGAALEALVAEVGPSAIIVLGDDRTDAEAFAVVQALRDEPRHDGPGRRPIPGLTVGVSGGAETPTEIIATADVMVDGPNAVARLLAAVALALERAAP